MKTSKSCYFPAQDYRTSRWESVAFCGLGLAAAVLITTAMINAAHFAEQHDAVVQAWSTSRWNTVELAHRTPDETLTNLLRVHAAKAGTHADVSPGKLPLRAGEALTAPGQTLINGTLQFWRVEAPQ